MLVALVLALAAPAPGLSLDWQAPAGCPDQATVRGRVAAMLGAAAIEGSDLAASGRVRASGEGWRLELELVRAAGRERRSLADRDCAALADAAALMIAVTIDPRVAVALPQAREAVVPEVVVPEAVVPEVVVPPPLPAVPQDRPAVPEDRPAVPEDRAAVAPRAASEAVPQDSPGAPEAVPKDRPVRRRIELGLRAAAGASFTRILPGPSAALELALALGGRGWRVELGGGFAPPVRTTVSATPAIGGSFRLGFAELRGCGVPALRRAPLAFPLCVGLQVGAMHGQGEGAGLEQKLAARSLWLATRLGGALRWRPRDGRVALWLGLDAIVALTRPSFETAGGVRVHRAAGVGGQALVGVEVRLR